MITYIWCFIASPTHPNMIHVFKWMCQNYGTVRNFLPLSVSLIL